MDQFHWNWGLESFLEGFRVMVVHANLKTQFHWILDQAHDLNVKCPLLRARFTNFEGSVTKPRDLGAQLGYF